MAGFKRANKVRSREGREKTFAESQAAKGKLGKSSKRAGKPFAKSGRPSSRRESSGSRTTVVTCASCKKKCDVPFTPTNNKPVYCSHCFRKESSSSKKSSSPDHSGDLKEINQKLDKIMRALGL